MQLTRLYRPAGDQRSLVRLPRYGECFFFIKNATGTTAPPGFAPADGVDASPQPTRRRLRGQSAATIYHGDQPTQHHHQHHHQHHQHQHQQHHQHQC